MTPLPSMMDFVVAIVAAFLGGAVVKRLGQPPVLGYLLAGIVVGPFATGLISDIARINTLAQIGVAFLMFQAGTELSLSQLRKMQGITLAGPFVQLLLMAPFVVVAVFLTQLPIVEVSYLGIILALSSTTVVIKLMAGRGEVDALHGRLAIAFSIVQDLPMIPAIVIFTSFALAANTLTSGALTLSVLGGLGKALAFVAVAYFVGAKLFPPFLKRIASYGGDLFLLCVVAVALGMAFLSSLLGISLVLGAFIAGLVVAESEVTYRVSREVSPISDIFVTFFFVSVGMLLDIPFVFGHLSAVMVIVLVVVFGKAVLLTAIGFMFRYSGRTSFLMGLTLAQIGEEAFLLAQIGLQHGILTTSSYSLVLAGAVTSIVLNPLLLTASPSLLRLFQRVPVLKQAFLTSTQDPSGAIPEGLQGHTIVCGYGQVGEELAQALDRHDIKYVVIDVEPRFTAALREKGVPVIHGDASNPLVLSKANLMRARCLVVTIPNPLVAGQVVRRARQLRRGLYIVVRGTGGERVVEELLQAGASEVIHPSFESSLEFTRSVLRDHGVSPKEVERLVQSKRIGFYG